MTKPLEATPVRRFINGRRGPTLLVKDLNLLTTPTQQARLRVAPLLSDVSLTNWRLSD